MSRQPSAAAAAAAAVAAASATATAKQGQPVLPWMRVPLGVATGSGVPLAAVQGLHPQLHAGLTQSLGFSELFPVQAAVWRNLAGGSSTTHDMCICAPTGSGKTLAYALPLMNAILTGCQPDSYAVLQALVVLPTRSLAVQVHAVLYSLGFAAGITVALAAAQESVAAEAAKLTAQPSQPGSGPHVLVATPGRLVSHLQGNTSACWQGGSSSVLSLRHLRFMVVDEADRLLRQDYHGWLPQVLEMIQAAHSNLHSHCAGLQLPGGAVVRQQASLSGRHSCQDLTALPPPGAVSLWQGSGSGSGDSGSRYLSAGESNAGVSRVVKLVVSATLTRDPSKLMQLQLHHPRYITLAQVNKRYVLPPALQQYRLVVPAQHKPLALVGLLHRLAGTQIVVFASTLDMTHRLYLLLAAVPWLSGIVAEYSSNLAPEAQVEVLAAFKQGRSQVLVTSDTMARGMDIMSLSCVINYDPPTYPKTYIHRAGRTARAGKTGNVYTLLKPEDVVHFNSMLRKVDGSKVQHEKLLPAELQQHRPALKAALKHVQELVQLEKQQDKRPGTAAATAASNRTTSSENVK